MEEEDKTPEEVKLTKKQIKAIAKNNDLKVTNPEVDRIYNEQDKWGKKNWDDLSDGHFDKDDEVPQLT